MADNQLHLLKSKRFMPLFVTQFLGALNDNFFKNALVILVLYRIAAEQGGNGQLLVTMAAGIFVLPFFLFSALAGQMADKFEKSRMVRWIKLAEILVMAMGAYGLILGNAYFLLVVLFCMGLQSTMFGPLKYSLLPVHLREDELIGGNGLIEAGTFVAILIGTIVGGLLILEDYGVAAVSIGVLALAAAGYLSSFFIPKAVPAAPDLRLSANFIGETFHVIGMLRKRRDVFLSVLGISWFWLVGATLLAQFPNLAKEVLNADQTVVTLFLTVFSIGIGIGSVLCSKLLNGEVSARYVPLGALGMTLFIFDLYMAATGVTVVPGAASQGVGQFLATVQGWRLTADLFAMAICGGLFIVPLYALMQSHSEKSEVARIVAGNNILNAAFMVVGALAATAMLALNFTVPEVFLVMAAINLFVAFYICKLLPGEVIKMVLRWLLKLCYRVEVKGAEHYRDLGDRAVIVVNHVSFLDGILLAAFLPKKPTFAIDSFVARQWWVKPFLKVVDAFPMDPTNPMAIKSLIRVVQEGRQCVIFPEGRITVTGALMKIYEGPGMIADKADAPLVPVRIDGAQFTPFSRLKGKVRLRLFPKITITILPPRSFELPAEATGRARRQIAGAKLYDQMTEMVFETCNHRQTLFQALLDARLVHGGKAPVVEDIERKPIGYNRLILGSLVLGRRLARITAPQERVGVLLPNSAGAAVTFFALQAFNRVPAMLNFSTGLANMQSACRTAQVKTILTSRRFVELGKLTETVEELGREANIVYLEDLKQDLGVGDKLYGLLARPFARKIHARKGVKSNDAAVVLFTSGSEGQPKGVVLSHENLLANRQQLAACVDFNPKDTVFNALPIFHSFGLTGGMLLPLLSGIRTFLYPSPLHYRIVPALVYDSNATIMFGTDTFLSGYARVSHPYDFYSIRYVFAGAEKVKEETRRIWSDKFGLRIFEGYGATETSPVLATNTPMHFKAGTVGRFLPGIEHHLEPVPGIDTGGRLIVEGPNVMKGYLLADKPGILQPPQDGRYDTGDIVSVDSDGFVTIQGRAKRFAKIAGEMVSLTAVEGHAAALWPDAMHAVVGVPDARKGEQLILVTDHGDAERNQLMGYAKDNGIPELMVPRNIHVVDKMPVLGTGKLDYVTIQDIVSDLA